MAIAEVRRPYEFLARWNPLTGVFSGAHVQFYDAIEKDGVQIAGAPSKAFGVGEGLAFPLSDILAQMHTDALALIDTQGLQIATLTESATTATAERDAALAQVADLTAQLAALKPAVIDGVPQEVTRFQARAALDAAVVDGVSLLDRVEAAIASDATPRLTKLAWADAQTFKRTSPTVAGLAQALGLSDAAIDALFVAAAQIEA